MLSKEAHALAADRAAAEAKGAGGAAAEGPPPPPTAPAHLALLYSDAERTLPRLHDLSAEIKTQQPSAVPVVAPLKGEARAAFKTLDKYGGDYSRLTDLARMCAALLPALLAPCPTLRPHTPTQLPHLSADCVWLCVCDRTVQCKTLKDVKAVLEMLRSHAGFEVLLIKNRLMLAFDASVSGGYRDLLLNLRCVATGHIVEVQITLKGLIDVKAGGGHANYAIARVHRLFERDAYRYEGALGDAVLEGVRCGVVRELVCRGKASGLAAHFGRLLAALRSPSCGLRELRLVGCDWPEGRTLSELVEALPATGLKTLVLESMQVGGALPEAVIDKCAGAEVVLLDKLGLTGGVPASFGKCTKLKSLLLWGNQLTGPIPNELGQCEALEELYLNQNQLTGGVPASVGKCAKLKKLLLGANQLEGPIPDWLGQCDALEWLYLNHNQLTGGVPASLGKCAKLTRLKLDANQLEGAVPATELAALTALTDLVLDKNEGLTITASRAQALKNALPDVKLLLPKEVAD